MTLRTVAAVVVAAGVLASCGGSPPDPDGRATDTGSPGPLQQGTAEVRVRGGVRDEFAVALDSAGAVVYQPPSGGFAVSWASEDQGLGLGGRLFRGTRPTGEDLSLTVTIVADDVPVVFASMAGECEVTIDAATRDELAGSFRCAGISAQGITVNARGTFSAAA